MTLDIANRLIELRKKSGYSQEKLAELLGLSRQAVSKWERAEASPDTDNLILLSRLYGVSLDELLNSEEADENFLARDSGTTHLGNTTYQEIPKPDQFFSPDADADGNKTMLPISMVAAVLFLVIGFITGIWSRAWMIFLFVPLVDSLIRAIKNRDASQFLYPVLMTIIFLLMGFYRNLWHPGWIVFVTIPIYYAIVNRHKGNHDE